MIKNTNFIREQITNPLIYDQNVSDFLADKGIFYIYGFDHSFRPLLYFNPRLVEESFFNDTPFCRNVLNRVVSYIEERIFVRGKTESCVLIINVDKLSYFELKKVVKRILGVFDSQLHLITRIYRIYFVNSSTSLKLMQTISLPFISNYLKDLVRITSGNSHEEMQDHINPQQLEMKYGGYQCNLKKGEFW